MKVLIFHDIGALKPVGGPSGYLYNLRQEMKRVGDSEIYFLQESSFTKLKRYIKKNILPKCAVDKYEKKKNEKSLSVYLKQVKKESQQTHNYKLQEYDVVHFHNTFEMYRIKKDLENYQGIVILTSHSPKVYFKELIEDVADSKDYIENEYIFDSAEEFDRYAFERADCVIFPCPGAEEPYYHSWPAYRELRDESKIRYVPTGILPVTCKRSKDEVRKQYGIPENVTLLSFVGRHNKVKGYDLLQEIFARINNVYVICCGNISTIHSPHSNRWIEVGWTDDPYSIVGASDIYMLPNRETYFDIAMLQTLSIGKCSVISNTGGNKEFSNAPGVKLYNIIEEAVEFVNQFQSMSIKERSNLETLQRTEFVEKYTIDSFYNRYKNTLAELLEERKNGSKIIKK